MINIKVDESNKLINWNKANLTNFFHDDDNGMDSDEEDEKIMARKRAETGMSLNQLLNNRERDFAQKATAEWSGNLAEIKRELEHSSMQK